MKIISWNVNGIRSAENKGLREYLDTTDADIVGLQEIRAKYEDIPPALKAPKGWHAYFSLAERPGYSGVGLYTRKQFNHIASKVGVEEFDREGRLQLARLGNLVIVNGYFPNGSGKDRDNSRVPFKLRFYRHVYELLQTLTARGREVLVMGDFNIAHQAIDLARPKQNEKTSGFLPEEREELNRWLTTGWVDTFRHFEKGPNHYSWWSQRAGSRQRNIGWRIDYVLVNERLMPRVRNAFILPHIYGSDHCPVGVALNR